MNIKIINLTKKKEKPDPKLLVKLIKSEYSISNFFDWAPLPHRDRP